MTAVATQLANERRAEPRFFAVIVLGAASLAVVGSGSCSHHDGRTDARGTGGAAMAGGASGAGGSPGSAGRGQNGGAGGTVCGAGRGAGGAAGGGGMTVVDLKVSLAIRRPTTFRLTWTVSDPASGGDAGTPETTMFDVRLARVPICGDNFDSSAVAEIAAAAAVGKPGDVLSVDIGGLYPETQYYFGVAARTGGGGHGPVASVAAEPARFNLTVLDRPATGDLAVDGTADLNGDNLSDLVVGTGSDVFIYFGSPEGYGAPGVHIAPVGDVLPGDFGSHVLAGDLDGDARPDLVVTGHREVYVFSLKSHPAGWPAELDSSQADYVIHGAPLYTQFAFGAPLARAGDFDGDGYDDLALGVPLSGDNMDGNVFIVRGGPSFASFTAPDPAHAILISHDSDMQRAGFGTFIAALGPYYGSLGGSLAIGSFDRLFTFAAPMPGQSIISTDGRRDLLSLSSPDQLAPFGAAPTGLMVASTGAQAGVGGLVDVFTGAPSDGLFSQRRRWTALVPSFAPEDRFVWGGLGTSQTPGAGVIGSWIGDGGPDLLVAHQTNAHTWLVMFDGAGLRAAPNGETAVTMDTSPGDVTIDRFPDAWGRFGVVGGSAFIPDCNGDRTGDGSSTSDFAIGFFNGQSATRLVVFW